ncbi:MULTISPECIES: amino acid ABC transporter permease [unclassified Pseudofrankia]|uniref:amino acid ABC transporter permease n=1 Tax=unclassified Pseudofrankia TaxID=2994372 RepID=UPI0012FFA2B9|nr:MULTISPECIES: amino acid ABC transporter permease [unclassified Pseudofrankia]MDT3440746.1 amino acid ABC transporter permease [Pseudofrankia sp. BMG5.37]
MALVVIAATVVSFLGNEALEWSTVGRYLFDQQILDGLGMTVTLAVISMAVGLVLACIVAAMRLSGILIVRGMGAVFVWFFRGVPLLVLLVVTFNIGLLYPNIVVGLPFYEPLVSLRTSDLISPRVCAVVAFSLYEAAYGSEVVRSSLMSVPTGQREAGAAIGMTSSKVFRRIVFPQGMRIATPLLANQFIQMTKNTSIVAYIAVPDLLYSAQSVYSRTFEIIPLLLVVTIWYLVLVALLTIAQSYLERRFGAHERPRRTNPLRKQKAISHGSAA